MLIQELTRQASLDLLARTRLGRLACAQGTQPYVVPFYFTYDNDYLYSFTTVGQKIEWMRANPLVCVEADEVVSPQEWVSVVVFGRYEELPDTPEWRLEREFAYKLLQQYAMWWEPGYVKTILHGIERPLAPIFYRIDVDRMTGHLASLEPGVPPDTRLSRRIRRNGLPARILRLIADKLKQWSFYTPEISVWERVPRQASVRSGSLLEQRGFELRRVSTMSARSVIRRSAPCVTCREVRSSDNLG